MHRLAIPIFICTLIAADDKPVPKLPLGRETTYVTGPLDNEGYIDYKAALNGLLGKGVTPENNASVLLWKAIGPRPRREGLLPSELVKERGLDMPLQETPPEYFKRLGISVPPKEGEYFVRVDAFVKDQLKLSPKELEIIEGQLDIACQRPWLARDYPTIAAWLQANEKPLALVVEASQRPVYFSPWVSAPADKSPSGAVAPDGNESHQSLTRALATRAMLRTAEKMQLEAWQDLVTCHRLSRLISRGRSLIDSLIALAIESSTIRADLAYLQNSNLNSQQIRNCMKELRDLQPMTPLAVKIDVAERISSLDTLQGIVRYGISQMDGEKVWKPTAAELKALRSFDWAPVLRAHNHWYDRWAAAVRFKSRADREQALDRIEADFKELQLEAVQAEHFAKFVLGNEQSERPTGESLAIALIGSIAPAVRKVEQTYDRCEQEQRNLDLAFALAAYHIDHGRYPAKLDDMAPKYLAAIPVDIFSGKPIIYKPSANGYLLYSVGPNGKDEGGRKFDDDPLPGDDLPVQMPLPELKPWI
jgi:hypothetical protein